MDRATHYPHHLAKLVATRLRADYGRSPPETVLCRLLETLYFASLKTDEGRRVLCTVEYLDPQGADAKPPARGPANRPTCARFDPPLPLDVRTLTKLARAADPRVASLAVFSDRKQRLYIWAMVDQEPRLGDEVALEPDAVRRPGLFSATITGAGNLSVYCGSALVGSLAQNALVQEHHNVLGSGPVHAMLKDHLEGSLAERFPRCEPSCGGAWQRDLLVYWVHSVGRVLVEAGRYRHGGGLLIVPEEPAQDASVHYVLRYDRLLKALVDLAQSRVLHRHLSIGDEAAGLQDDLGRQKSEVLGAIRFIASLSCADGVVLLDKAMAVRGFGAELRAANPINDVFLAGDAAATAARLRRADLSDFGARQRAMIRYCDAHPGSLGLAISREGGVHAMMRIGQRLVLWENIDCKPATAGRAP
jgi:hypothetical protein